MKKKILIILALLMVFPLSAWALTIPLDTAFSNYDPGEPGYNAHYGDVEITDIGNEVRFDITVDTDVSGPNADLQWFYFNSIIEPVPFDVSIVGDDYVNWSLDNLGTNPTHSPDGDGYFDFFVDFGNGSPTLQTTSFTVAINGEDLGIDNFLQQSTGRDQKGHYTVAAHIQSTSTDPGSEFVGGNPPTSVPEPSIVFLLGSLLIGIGVIDRRLLSS